MFNAQSECHIEGSATTVRHVVFETVKCKAYFPICRPIIFEIRLTHKDNAKRLSPPSISVYKVMAFFPSRI